MGISGENEGIEPPNCGGASGSVNSALPAGWLYKPGEALPKAGTYYGPEHGSTPPCKVGRCTVQRVMEAVTADLLVRASKGDAKARSDLAAIERTRSQ